MESLATPINEHIVLSRVSYDKLILDQLESNRRLALSNEFIEQLLTIINYVVSSKRDFDTEPAFKALREITSALNLKLDAGEKGIRISK